MKPKQKKEEHPFHTIQERLVIEQIRLKALKYQKTLLDDAHRKGKLPTQDEFLGRIVAAAWRSAEKKVPFRPSKKKQ